MCAVCGNDREREREREREIERGRAREEWRASIDLILLSKRTLYDAAAEIGKGTRKLTSWEDAGLDRSDLPRGVESCSVCTIFSPLPLRLPGPPTISLCLCVSVSVSLSLSLSLSLSFCLRLYVSRPASNRPPVHGEH